MPTRQKSFSRSLIRSNKFWSLRSDAERLFYVLVMLDLDNIGRGLGSEHYLKGKLYEKDPQTSAESCQRYLQACHDVGILLQYEKEGIKYIQDPVHLEHNKIVGNMKAESDYPEPPEQIMADWEHKFGKVYTKSEQGLSEDKDKEEDEDKEGEKKSFLHFLKLSTGELDELVDKYGQKNVKTYMEKLDNYIGSKGRKYKSHFFTLKSWMQKDGIYKPKEEKKSSWMTDEEYKEWIKRYEQHLKTKEAERGSGGHR